MDPKTWMREALSTGAFAGLDNVSARDLARAAQVALRLGRDQTRQCKAWAAEVLAETRPPRPPRRPPGPSCKVCGKPLWATEKTTASTRPAALVASADPEMRAALDRISALVQRALERVMDHEERSGVCGDCFRNA